LDDQMGLAQKKEEEFKGLLESYAGFISFQIHKFNLAKYGLDPEDVLQDVKIRIWKLIRRERNVVNHASYIKKIVNSAAIDQLRKRHREEDLFKHERQKHISELEFSYSRDIIRKKIFEETVGKAVERLIDSRRQAVKLYLLSLTIQEISTYLNWSKDKTRNLLYRGLADLRKYLKDMDAENENRQ
jgi:RNA polymerase sigma factor (sigma-70 family)